MLAAPRVEVHMPVAARADYLLEAYADIVADGERLAAAIAKLKGLQSKERVAGWQELAAEGRFAELAHQLIEQHYDPLYARSRKRREDEPVAIVSVEKVSDADLARAAHGLLEQVS